MRSLTTDVLRELLTGNEPPCISLYQPTHRANPDSLQDPIRYKNLVRDAERSLREKYSGREVRPLLEPFQALAGDYHFWTHQREGLAVLAAADRFEVFRLQRPVRELVVVADSFHLKPLLRMVQSADRYQVLCLDRHEAKLFEGKRDALDEVDKDMDRFFRVIDGEVLTRFSRTSGLPLVLAALPEYHAEFRRISRNPLLQPDGVAKHPGALTPEQLRAEVWQVVEPKYFGRLARLTEDHRTAAARGLAASALNDVARAAVADRIGVLLVEADRVIPGRFDAETGEVRPKPTRRPRGR